MPTWSDVSEEELVRELLDDQSPFFVLPEKTTEPKTNAFNEDAINRLISTVYSGPTIGDIENALSVTTPRKDHQLQELSQARLISLDSPCI